MIAIIESVTNSFETYMIKDVISIIYINRECRFITKDGKHYACSNDNIVISFA